MLNYNCCLLYICCSYFWDMLFYRKQIKPLIHGSTMNDLSILLYQWFLTWGEFLPREETKWEPLLPYWDQTNPDELYVFCNDNPCLHIFSNVGQRLRSTFDCFPIVLNQLKIYSSVILCLRKTAYLPTVLFLTGRPAFSVIYWKWFDCHFSVTSWDWW